MRSNVHSTTPSGGTSRRCPDCAGPHCALVTGDRPGAHVLRELIGQRGGDWTPQASFLESSVRRLLKQAGLPDPAPQWEVRERGRLLARVDLAYPETKVAIEADGYRFHSGRLAWHRDLARRNTLTSRGWQVLHVT